MKKYWTLIKEHPIYSKVASGLILTGLLAILNQAFSWNIFSSIINLATQKYIVPMWVLLVIGVAPIILVIVGYFLYNRKEFLPECVFR
jgi:hypothetical protein